jgi:hypothetical protein
VRECGGQEMALPRWERSTAEDCLGRWAMNLMLSGLNTHCFGRTVRLPDPRRRSTPFRAKEPRCYECPTRLGAGSVDLAS